MKLKQFGISLNSANGVYYAGQILDGYVTVELHEAMKMRGVRLLLNGKASVHWSERHSSGSGKKRRTRTVHYRGSEQYFNFEVLLFGPGTGSTELVAGKHMFPFNFQLPPSLPSSYESSIGNVRYSLKGTIDRPWKFDHHTKRLFTVLSLLDLNLDPNAPLPQLGQNHKHLCILCCKTGPISAVFRLDRTGYVPGDTVYINAEVNNQSNRTMASSSVRLIMITVYRATSKSKTVTKEVACKKHGEIAPYGSDTWSGERFVIPPLPPSFLVGCNIIDIRYILQLEVDPRGPAFDLEVPLGIIIGTIPLRAAVQQYAPPSQFYQQAVPSAPQVPYAPAMPSAPGAPCAPDVKPSQPDPAPAPPPSYAECVFGKVDVTEEEDNEHMRGDKNFAPVYTFYNWPQQ